MKHSLKTQERLLREAEIELGEPLSPTGRSIFRSEVRAGRFDEYIHNEVRVDEN